MPFYLAKFKNDNRKNSRPNDDPESDAPKCPDNEKENFPADSTDNKTDIHIKSIQESSTERYWLLMQYMVFSFNVRNDTYAKAQR